jgi:NAD(P)-dependent dehydrogenase (short-subunit alcohol dehydrogenase family)
LKPVNAYPMSKALLNSYGLILAKKYPHLIVSGLYPGFVNTNMTKGMKAPITPEEGCKVTLHCLFSELRGSGWFYH